MKHQCPYCKDKFGEKKEYSHHITLHVVEIIRKDYPGLLEQIEAVEKSMPVKFMLKVDTDNIANIEQVAAGATEIILQEEEDES